MVAAVTLFTCEKTFNVITCADVQTGPPTQRWSRYVPLRMLRRSFPQKASRRGSSALMSSPEAGLSSGELGPRLTGGGEDTPEAWGKLGERVAVGGGEEKPEGGRVDVGGGDEMEGQ